MGHIWVDNISETYLILPISQACTRTYLQHAQVYISYQLFNKTAKWHYLFKCDVPIWEYSTNSNSLQKSNIEDNPY